MLLRLLSQKQYDLRLYLPGWQKWANLSEVLTEQSLQVTLQWRQEVRFISGLVQGYALCHYCFFTVEKKIIFDHFPQMLIPSLV